MRENSITVRTLVAIQASSSTLLVVKAAGAIPPDGLNQNMLEPKQTPSLQPDAGTGTEDYGATAETSTAHTSTAALADHRSSSTSRHQWYEGNSFLLRTRRRRPVKGNEQSPETVRSRRGPKR